MLTNGFELSGPVLAT